jgi:phosphatidylglycerophosphatase A
VAPGTVGSAVALGIIWLLPGDRAGLVVFFVVVTVAGVWAADRAERHLGSGKDPGAIVVDEVAGMTLSVMFFPRTLAVLLAGFVLFRLFDVVKPPPARASQHLSGGVGVMVDDLIAGAYAAAVLALSRSTLAWP